MFEDDDRQPKLKDDDMKKETFAQFKSRLLRKHITGWRAMRARDRWDKANGQGIWHINNPSNPNLKTTAGTELNPMSMK